MDDWAAGLTIDDLPALPEHWATKSLDKLNGGHLIRLKGNSGGKKFVNFMA